jgi:hypothetical protein
MPRSTDVPAISRLLETPAGRPLAATSVIMLLVLGAAVLGLLLDPRVITGAPAWLKPAKFAISIAIYSFTLLWLLSFVRGHDRLVRIVAWGTAATLLLEEAIIVGQVVRGTASHFNATTAFDSALFSIMGLTIVGTWVMGMLAAGLLLRQRLDDAAFAWSLRLGLVVALVGMAVAILMTSANPGQSRAAADRAQRGLPPTSGAHSVGLPSGDGGAGLPVLGWSTEGGDLRAPHFFGIHAINVLPLLGWALSRRRQLTSGQRVGLVWTAGLGYLGVVLLLTWQALRGQSLIAPDGTTLAVAGALVAGVVLAALVITSRPRQAIAASRVS